jgi:hypothetical protein
MERRWFFRRIAGEGLALIEELSGRPQLRLDDLGHVPDEAVFALKPMFVPGVTVFADAGRMLGRRPGRDPVDLYALDDAGTFVLSRFDGWSPLGDVAAELVSARKWSEAEARALARDVFLRLVALGLCAPTNQLDDRGSDAARFDSDTPGGNHE